MDTVEVDGLRLGYRRAGHGRTVMFVHGGAEDSRTWTPQLDALSDEFTVIAWDEPGAGGSDDVRPEFGLSEYADCLAGMIRALGVSPTAVVGLSWGTTVILELYRRHPVVVRSVVLADGYAGWRGSLGAEEADARLRAQEPRPAPELNSGCLHGLGHVSQPSGRAELRMLSRRLAVPDEWCNLHRSTLA